MVLKNSLRWSLPALLITALGPGCSSPIDPDRLLVENTFDAPPPAGTPAAVLSAEEVHAGAQAAKIGPETEFTPLSTTSWEALGQSHHIRLRLWSWFPDNREHAVMLVVVTRHNDSQESLSYQTVNVREMVRRYRQWVPNTFFISLPRTLVPTDVVNVFLWAPPSPRSPVYIDDFSIEKLD